jgi:serine/threonine-protein kinase
LPELADLEQLEANMENSAGMNQEPIGTRRGDYEILGLLGAGGMGQVYKVRNVYSDRIEAMKVLLPNLADQKNLADRFVREIKVLAGLHHPNIAELRTALTIDNQLVMIMEYVEGATLAVRVQQGAIPYGQALGYIQQVLSALSYAHKQHIIHRDIKPSNMMLTPDGVVKLMDFGIARQGNDVGLTLTNTTLGSLSYMSPEQVKGEQADARSDLYSVGVSLYEMVTGQRPFQADTAFSTMQAHLHTPARPPIELRPDLPPAISQLILMAVAKDPARRFQTAEAFAGAITSVMPKVEGTTMAVPTPLASTTSAGGAVVSPVPTLVTVATPDRPGAAHLVQEAQASAPLQSSADVQATPPGPINPAVQATRMPPPVGAQNTHRGLYITLGALIVVVVLVAAGLYVPRYAKTTAIGRNSTPPAPKAASVVAPAPPAPSDVATPAAAPNAPTTEPPAANPTPNASGPADANAGAEPKPAGDQPNPAAPLKSPATPSKRQTPKQSPPSVASAQSQSNSDVAAAPSGPDPAQLKALDLEVDQLSSRTSAVTAGLDTLRQQQNAQGLGLRGDIVASQQRMQTYLAKAQAALQAQDVDGAKRYLDLAEAETERIEKFLGR